MYWTYYDEGYDDFYVGYTREENPYFMGTAEYDYWVAGWVAARMDFYFWQVQGYLQ